MIQNRSEAFRFDLDSFVAWFFSCPIEVSDLLEEMKLLYVKNLAASLSLVGGDLWKKAANRRDRSLLLHGSNWWTKKCLCMETKGRIECHLEYHWQLDGDSWMTKRVINTTQKDWMNMDEWASTNSCCPCRSCSRRCCRRLILHLVPMAGLQDITNGALKQHFIVLILQVESRDGSFWGAKRRLGRYLLVCSGLCCLFWHVLTWLETKFCSIVSHQFATKLRVGFTPESQIICFRGVIIVEDDLIFSPDFLNYFQASSWKMEGDKNMIVLIKLILGEPRSKGWCIYFPSEWLSLWNPRALELADLTRVTPQESSMDFLVLLVIFGSYGSHDRRGWMAK